MIQKHLLGRIIFSNLLQMPLWQYYQFIDKLNVDPVIAEWLQEGLINKYNIATFYETPQIPDKTHFAIGSYMEAPATTGFSTISHIKYIHPYFQHYYNINNSLWNNFRDPSLKKRLLHQLKRINSRNALTHCLLEIILAYQINYLTNGNRIFLKEISRIELTKMMGRCNTDENFFFLTFKQICYTWIARLVPNLAIILADHKEVPVGSLLINKRNRLKFFLDEILRQENKKMINREIKYPHSDNELKAILSGQFNFNTSLRNINSGRNASGIPNAKVRYNNFDYLIEALFSKEYPLAIKNINQNIPEHSGVYEILFRSRLIEYPKGRSPVFYIGRSKNLKKRLAEYMNKNFKKRTVFDLIKQAPCNYRYYITGSDYQQEEIRLYELFVKTYGSPPLANKIAPGISAIFA
ncbi:MAG: hypothetical protein IIA88_00725 [Bacteroidetes bacterium]|nr:hypothetical protein [Bacteroidota bacterium]